MPIENDDNEPKSTGAKIDTSKESNAQVKPATTLADGTEQEGQMVSTGNPTAMADTGLPAEETDTPPTGGQSSGAKVMSSKVYSKEEIESKSLPPGISDKQSSGSQKANAGISGTSTHKT